MESANRVQKLQDLEKRTGEYLWFLILNGILVFIIGSLFIVFVLASPSGILEAALIVCLCVASFGSGIFAYIQRHYLATMGAFVFYLIADIAFFFLLNTVITSSNINGFGYAVGSGVIFTSLAVGSYKLLLIFKEMREIQFGYQGTLEIPMHTVPIQTMPQNLMMKNQL